MPVSSSLSQKQIQCAQHLALGESHKQAGKAAGVSRATVCRWLKDTLFLAKIEEFRQELEQIEGSAYTEAVKEVGETIRENVRKILTADELKAKLSEIIEGKDIPLTHQIKAAAILGKWIGLEAPKPSTAAAQAGNEFPIHDLGEAQDIESLSDEELQKLYLKTLAES